MQVIYKVIDNILTGCLVYLESQINSNNNNIDIRELVLIYDKIALLREMVRK